MLSIPIVVFVDDFDENSGGGIVLHVLAHRLRQLGEEVYIANLSTLTPASRLRRAGRFVKHLNHVRLAWKRNERPPLRQRVLHCHPSMPLPTLHQLPKGKFVALYPEIIHGNPFNAPNVARWLLHRAGKHRPDVRFSQNEVTFYYQPAFAEGTMVADPDYHLQVRWLRTDIYRNEGMADREGSCRMVRKGQGTYSPEMSLIDSAPPMDGLSHSETAAMFNRCERFYCHDPYTMYLYYAALCGCIPVVVPQPGLDAGSWRAGFELKKGVAYGEDELEFARSTREELLADMAGATETETASVKRFIEIMRQRVYG